jgi:hypothetical protein
MKKLCHAVSRLPGFLHFSFSLSELRGCARYFQISVPIQPGNSSVTLAENVNYAVKSSYLLSFLEYVPEVAARLKEPNMKDRKFEDVVRDMEQATVLVLVY